MNLVATSHVAASTLPGAAKTSDTAGLLLLPTSREASHDSAVTTGF